MIPLEWYDALWLIPIIGQATETLAATTHMNAQKTAIIASQSALIQPRRFVPFIARFSLNRFLYFIPSSIGRVVKLTVFYTKELTLKVFGSGQ